MKRFKDLSVTFLTMRLVIVIVVFSLFALSGHFTNTPGQTSKGCGLGTVWDEYEVGGWHGTWTRRGKSSTFDSVYKLSGYDDIHSVLEISINGDKVSVSRTDEVGWASCKYEGTLSSDGVSVSGTYSCLNKDGAKSPTYSWNATINCGGTSKPYLGRWNGTYRNSKGQSGSAYISFSENATGKITGNEDGVPIENVTVSGNDVWYNYKWGCRTVEGRLTINADGKTASGSYTVTECNGTDKYTGNYINYKKQ